MNLEKETKDYLSFVRKHPCIVCFEPHVDADHLQVRGMGGIGRKKGRTHTGTIADFACVPLCRLHHTERHSHTLRDFEKKHKVNCYELVHHYFSTYVYSCINYMED